MRRVLEAVPLAITLNLAAFLLVLFFSKVEAFEGLVVPLLLVLLPGTWVSAAVDPHFDLKGSGYSSIFFTLLAYAVNALLYFGIALGFLTWRNRQSRKSLPPSA